MEQQPTSTTTGTERLLNVQQGEQTPLVRVSLFGAFQMEWQVPPATEEALWDSRTSARVLLKLMLCAPGRQASKSVLAGILWPETDEEKARESLRQAVNILRKMLRTVHGEELLEQRNKGEILKVAAQSQLWVDADAFEALVAKASRATIADEALGVWQEAHALLSGEFLADDQASEWARHPWVKRRKQALWMARCRLIRHLADLYLQRGEVPLAEEVLEQHLVRFPSDQDALYRLLVLLEQQQCYEQASILYEKMKRGLDAVGKQPARQVKACYERIQVAISSHALLPLSQTNVLFPLSERGKRDCPHPSPVATPVLSHGRPGGSEIAFTSTTSQISSLLNIDGPSTSMLDVIQILLEGEGRQDVSLLSRRQLLELGIAAFITRLAQLDSTRISAVEREELCRVLGQSIADSWKLFHAASNAEVLAVGRLQLSLIHQAHALIYPSVLPYLYAGAYSLIGIGLHFQERDEEALEMYHNGYLASLSIGDPWYKAASLTCQADSYHALGQYHMAIQAIEEALRVIGELDDQTVARIKSHLLSCWADNAMMLHNDRTTQEKLYSSEAYLEQIEPNEEFDRAAWLLIAGKYALNTGKNEVAKNYFEAALTELPEQWLLRRTMTATGLAMAYARMGERDDSLTIAKDLVLPIQTIDAQMTNRWFATYLRRDLLGIFPTDSAVQGFVADTCRQMPQQTFLRSSK